MSKFFCDSNCELWYDKVEELGITYISMPYTLDDEEYYYEEDDYEEPQPPKKKKPTLTPMDDDSDIPF